MVWGEFCSSSVVGALCFHCKGLSSIPGQGTNMPQINKTVLENTERLVETYRSIMTEETFLLFYVEFPLQKL